MAFFARGRLVVNGLAIVWTLVTVWYELVRFAYDVRSCDWPDINFAAATTVAKPHHILVIADPQILDHRSYPGRARFLTYLSRLIVDLNLRKNWWAANLKMPDAVVFLGDMMDGGRYDTSDEEYEAYYGRFRRIFQLHSDIPQYFVPGNHDVELGKPDHFSPFSRLRYITHFGQLNYDVHVANHTMTFIDAPGFVDEDYKRLGAGKAHSAWKSVPGGTIEHMKKFVKTPETDPVILFSHIPLYRPDGRTCGPLRERGTIRPGVGVGYQNTLGKQSSQELLEMIRPSLVFSGDDHDYCECIHTAQRPIHSSQTVREVSVKSLSMAMGIRRPGFQLLSLAPKELRLGGAAHADTPCLLPDQLGIYLNVYIPLLVISIVVVFLSGFFRASPRKIDIASAVDFGVPQRSWLTTSNLRSRKDVDEEQDILPQPISGPAENYRNRDSRCSSWIGRQCRLATYSWAIFIVSLPYHFPRRTRRHGSLMYFLYDVRDVAVYPIGIFICITWWFQ